MLKVEMHTEDIRKLERAYRDLDKLIELIAEHNKKYDKQNKPSTFLTDAHKCLGEVLYGVENT